MGVNPDFAAHEEAVNALGIQPDPVIEAEGKEKPAEKPAGEEPVKPAEKPAEPPATEDRKPPEEPEEGDGDDGDGAEDGDNKGDDKGDDKQKKVVPLARLKAEKRSARELREKLAIVEKERDDAKAALAEKPGSQTEDQKAVAGKVRDFAKKVAEKHGTDPEVLSDFAEGIMSLVSELTPKQKQELPEDVKKDLELLGIYKLDVKEKEQVNIFNGEYKDFEPELLKLYPNADKTVLAQAREELYKLARSKEYHTMPLDSVYFRNRSVFDTILKVAKGTKSGEAARGDLRDPSEEAEVDFTSPDMTPEKLDKYTEKQNQKRLSDNRIRFT